jgi:putative transcriptional regulator
MSETPTLDDLLAAHAAGSLPAPVALIVASHLALSSESRRRYHAYEAVGGTLLRQIEPVPCAPDAWDRLCAQLRDEDREPIHAPVPPAAPSLRHIPDPLRRHLPSSLEVLPWRRIGDATQADLDLASPGYRTTLVKVPPGAAYPAHAHEGTELILVLEGGFRDRDGRHLRGELVIAGPEIEHQPIAEPGQDWLWLRVLDAPLRPTGAVGRQLAPFWRL